MRLFTATLAIGALALALPAVVAHAAPPAAAPVIQADWHGYHGGWDRHWHHEWHDGWRPWHHHDWHREWAPPPPPYGYYYAPPPPPAGYVYGYTYGY